MQKKIMKLYNILCNLLHYYSLVTDGKNSFSWQKAPNFDITMVKWCWIKWNRDAFEIFHIYSFRSLFPKKTGDKENAGKNFNLCITLKLFASKMITIYFCYHIGGELSIMCQKTLILHVF